MTAAAGRCSADAAASQCSDGLAVAALAAAAVLPSRFRAVNADVGSNGSASTWGPLGSPSDVVWSLARDRCIMPRRRAVTTGESLAGKTQISDWGREF